MDTPADAVDESYPFTPGGFDVSNAVRNARLSDEEKKSMPQARKTGTTICGVCYKGGVVIGADTRATGELVVDKNCAKLHYVSPNIYCAGAGTAADCVQVTAMISSRLELLRMNTGAARAKVSTAMTMAKRHLFQYQGEISAALIMGGADNTGGHIYAIYPHGSTDKLPFASMGSGSLAAMSVLESQYKDDMSEEEAKAVVTNAIRAGIFNDLGSGSNVDLVVLRVSGETTYLRNYQTPNEVSVLRNQLRLPAPAFNYPVGTMQVTNTTRERLSTRAAAASGGVGAAAMEMATS